MCGIVPQNIYAPSGGVSRVATFNDDGDNSGDEAQNYFAGGEEGMSLAIFTFSLSPRVLSPSQRDKCPESKQGTRLWPARSTLSAMGPFFLQALRCRTGEGER